MSTKLMDYSFFSEVFSDFSEDFSEGAGVVSDLPSDSEFLEERLNEPEEER